MKEDLAIQIRLVKNQLRCTPWIQMRLIRQLILLLIVLIDEGISDESECTIDVDLAKNTWKRVQFSAACPEEKPSACLSIRRVNATDYGVSHVINIECGEVAAARCSVRQFDTRCIYNWTSDTASLIQYCCCQSVDECRRPIPLPFSVARKPPLTCWDYFQALVVLTFSIVAGVIINIELRPMVALVMRNRFLVPKPPLSNIRDRVSFEHLAAALCRHHIKVFRTPQTPSLLPSPRIVRFVDRQRQPIQQDRHVRLYRAINAVHRRLRTRMKYATEWHRSDLRRLKREAEKAKKTATVHPGSSFNPKLEEPTQQPSELPPTANAASTELITPKTPSKPDPETSTNLQTPVSLTKSKLKQTPAPSNSKKDADRSKSSKKVDKTQSSSLHSDSTQPLDDDKTEIVAKVAVEQTSFEKTTRNTTTQSKKLPKK
uniref:Protein sleepless n=1 Tax=Panagrellus redivivus TaxID=6233 RepID=A0A7E4V7N2_PANRE